MRRIENNVYLAKKLKSMKKILLSMIAICLLSFTENVNAQCTPDPAIKSSGTFPAVLAEASVGKPYAQVIQYYITKDTTVFVPQLGQTVSAKIDTLWIDNVIGMPQGFTYSCHNSQCKIVGGTGGCAKLVGTPTSGQVGIYPLVVLITIRATAFFGPLPIGQTVNDSNARYSIIVNPANGTTELTSEASLLVYPNPAKEVLQFYLPDFKGNANVAIYDMQGRKMNEKQFELYRSTGEIELNELKNGIYRIIMQTEKGIYSKTFIKE
jgi:hypothetical protein